MPLDAVSLRAVVEELRPQLLNLRIDKVQQPARDQVILLLRGSRRLLLNAGANAPRLQLTELPRDNPAEPPYVLYAAAEASGRLHGWRISSSGDWSGWCGSNWT